MLYNLKTEMIVYLITNNLNGKRYVGITAGSLEDRWKWHVAQANANKNIPLRSAILKYGPSAFSKEVLEECSDESTMKQREQFWIEKLETFAAHGKGYNATLGGDGLLGYKHTEAAKRAMSEKRTGEQNHNFGKVWGKLDWFDEDRQKMSEKRLEEKNPFFGKHHSDEAKKKISEATSLRKRKRVIQYNDAGHQIAIYNSMQEAAQAINASCSQKISDCCRNTRKTYRGFIWKYADENDKG